MERTPEPSIDPPEPKHISCGKCFGEIYEGQTSYEVKEYGTPICDDCFSDYFDCLSISEKAILIGAEEITVDFAKR